MTIPSNCQNFLHDFIKPAVGTNAYVGSDKLLRTLLVASLSGL